MDFGLYLKRRRKELKLNQTDVALACGLTRQSISLYERNRSPEVKAWAVNGLAAVLQIDRDEMLEMLEQMHAEDKVAV